MEESELSATANNSTSHAPIVDEVELSKEGSEEVFVGRRRQAEELIEQYEQINRSFALTIFGHDEVISKSLSLDDFPVYQPPVPTSLLERNKKLSASSSSYQRKLDAKQARAEAAFKPEPPQPIPPKKSVPLAGIPYKLLIPATSFHERPAVRLKPRMRLRRMEAAFEEFDREVTKQPMKRKG